MVHLYTLGYYATVANSGGHDPPELGLCLTIVIELQPVENEPCMCGHLDSRAASALARNGLLSSLPYLGKYLCALVSSVVADCLLRRGRFTTTIIRITFRWGGQYDQASSTRRVKEKIRLGRAASPQTACSNCTLKARIP
ncbi:hypothetical protein EVAR_53295_1 [Eumeta japonica]|uniref:Uncharacterized protein n=1 Tax=Eumeta variegata TaxID=151549 RepID=A0A4C1Z076_EUMVA|nr:hypothetical protein EVAR_53295_1 [Eumeta japonica]